MKQKTKKILILCLVFSMLSCKLLGQNPGTLDNTFGTNGTVLTPFFLKDGSQMYFISTTHLENGNILALLNKSVFDKVNSTTIDTFLLIRFFADGSIDKSFGSNGQVLINFQAENLLLLHDKKILICGQDQKETILFRINENGSIDNSFGSNGILYTGLFQPSSCFFLQSDGKLLIGGSYLSNTKMLLTRLEKDGTLDIKFGKNGLLPIDFDTLNNPEYLIDIAVQNDNKIVLLGSVQKSNNIATLTRLSADGKFDSTFNSTGKQTLTLSGLYPSKVLILPNKNILVGGNFYYNSFTQCNIIISSVFQNGSINKQFGVNGIRNTNFGGKFNTLHSICMQPDGKILCSGNSDKNFGMLRLTDLGALDLTFNSTGKVSTYFGSQSNSTALSCNLLSDGKILLSGLSFINDSTTALALARYNSGLVLGVDKQYPILNFKVYPVPAHDQISLNFTLLQSMDVKISLFNAQGQLIQVLLNSDILNSGYHSETIPLNAMPPNVYILEIKGSNFIKRTKVIIN